MSHFEILKINRYRASTIWEMFGKRKLSKLLGILWKCASSQFMITATRMWRCTASVFLWRKRQRFRGVKWRNLAILLGNSLCFWVSGFLFRSTHPKTNNGLYKPRTVVYRKCGRRSPVARSWSRCSVYGLSIWIPSSSESRVVKSSQ